MANTIDKDDLCELAKAVEIMRYVIQGITEDFFNKFNGENKDDGWKIAWEFNRNRARAAILSDYLFEMEKTLKQFDITFWRPVKSEELEKESVA